MKIELAGALRKKLAHTLAEIAKRVSLRPRIMLTRNKRAATFAFVGLMLLATAAALVFAYQPVVGKRTVTLYEYEMRAESSQQAHLKPNTLFPEGTVDASGVFSRYLLDELVVIFSARYTASQPAPVSVEYAVDAVMEGFLLSGDKRVTVYRKVFPVIAPKTAQANGELAFNEPVSVDLDEFERLSNEADAILGAKPGRDIRLEFRGKLRADAPGGIVEEPFGYTLPIPTSGVLVSVAGGKPFEKANAQTKEETTYSDQNRVYLPPLYTIAALLIALLVALVFFVRGPSEDESLAVMFRNVLKRHGSRMIRVGECSETLGDADIPIQGIEDLVRISDDAQRPVCYTPDENGFPIGWKLFVLDRDRRYVCSLRRKVPPTTPFGVDEVDERTEKRGPRVRVKRALGAITRRSHLAILESAERS